MQLFYSSVLTLTAWLDGEPYRIVATAPFPAPIGASGSEHVALDWVCKVCGPEADPVVVGTGTVDLSWTLDPAVRREWDHHSRSH